MSAGDFADYLLRAGAQVEEGPEKRLGDKVLLSALWEHFRAEWPDLAEFKLWLVRMHNCGLIRLARIDLVQVMDADALDASEVSWGVATWHALVLR